MAQAVERNFLFKIADEFGTFGTGADEAHFALEHVPQLRKLVDAGLADDAAHLGDAGVGLHGPYGAVLFGVGTHGAEFVYGEVLSEQTDAALFVDEGARRFDADGDGGQEHDRRRADQQGQRGGKVQSPFHTAEGRFVPGTGGKSLYGRQR